MKKFSKLLYSTSVVCILCLTGLGTYAQGVDNYFEQPVDGDNAVNFNGTWRVDSVAVTATGTELETLAGVTPGTALASKALVLGVSKEIATITTLTSTTVNATTSNAGADAAAGTFVSFPTTTASGNLIVAAVDSSSDVNVTISNADHGQASVISIPDGGQATANFILSESATQTIDGILVLGADASAGSLELHPATTASGTLELAAVDSSSDVKVTISNADHGQATVYSIPDIGVATGDLVPATATKYLVDTVTMSPLKWIDVTVAASALDGAGTVTVLAGITGDQYKIREVILVGGGTNYAGGGDRLIDLTDGTTVWTTIANADIESAPSASLRFGNAKVPFLTGTSNTASASNQSIRFVYSGGTTDHSATGSIVFSICLEKIA